MCELLDADQAISLTKYILLWVILSALFNTYFIIFPIVWGVHGSRNVTSFDSPGSWFYGVHKSVIIVAINFIYVAYSLLIAGQCCDRVNTPAGDVCLVVLADPYCGWVSWTSHCLRVTSVTE